MCKRKILQQNSNHLNVTQKNYKAYWSLIKILLNNKKIYLISPLYYNNRFITDYKEKAELFNLFFIFLNNECSLISINRSLPSYINSNIEKRLSTVALSVEIIGQIIQNLDSNKAHGHDNISIRMLKICGDSICKPLEIIFRQTLLTGMFPSEWKKELFLFTKNATSKILKIIVKFLCFQFAVKSVKD